MPLKGKKEHFYYAIAISMAFMFGCGFTTTLKSTFTPYIQDYLTLSYLGIQTLQFSFYMGYFIMSPLSGELLQRMKFEKCIPLGFAAIACGGVVFILAAQLKAFSIFILALFAIGSGIALLQVVGNLYVVLIGDSNSSLSRLTLVQAFTSVGMTTAPLFVANFILTPQNGQAISDANYTFSLQQPFYCIASVWLILFFCATFYRLPPARVDIIDSASRFKVLKNKGVLIAALGICVYVGVEVCTANFIVRFLQDPTIGNLPMDVAAKYSTFYWSGILLGRLFGARLFRGKEEKDLLIFHSLLGALLVLITILFSGWIAMTAVLSLGLCNSIMFPAIYSLGIKCAPKEKPQASGILCMANIGGAILPMMQALVADTSGVQISFIIPFIGYLLITGCAVKAGKLNADRIISRPSPTVI